VKYRTRPRLRASGSAREWVKDLFAISTSYYIDARYLVAGKL